MDDNELNEISRDPRFAGRLKTKTKKEKEAYKNLFEGLHEEEHFKDKRGRPWPKQPLSYAKKLIKKKEEAQQFSESSSADETLSDTDSSSDSDDELALADLQDADWYSLVKDAKEVDESTHRLAILHFDWDNSTVETLFLAIESFLPPGSCLEKVTIYPSEYGMKKMAEEEEHGPQGIWEKSDDDVDDSQLQKRENDETIPKDVETDEKKAWKLTSVNIKRHLRRYQLQRLKYFYAIAEFDSKEAAAAVYEACDGLEYASTGIRFDLRFVRDEETFSVPSEWSHVVSECCEVNRAKYKLHVFENSALHSTRITLGWDRTPAARTQWLREQFESEVDPRQLLQTTEGKLQLKEYLALSSSGQSTAAPSDVDEPGPAPTVPRIRRHRPLKPHPDQLRAALLAAIGTEVDERDSVEHEGSEREEQDDSEREEEEDLNAVVNSSNSEDEEYDLTTGDGSAERTRPHRAAIGLHKPARKRPLKDAAESDSSLDFDDMEDRLSDVGESDESGKRGRKNAKRTNHSSDADNSDLEKTPASKARLKRKLKSTMRKKMLMKKQKQESNQEKIHDLWTTVSPEVDSRFDEFLTDPAFGVSQLHRNYREATEFLSFMRRRRAMLKRNE